MSERRRQKRRVPTQHLEIQNCDSGDYIGLLANFSTDGMMFVSDDQIDASAALPCRIVLPQPIMDRTDIIFEAQHLWSRRNVEQGWWESGYKIKATKINKQMLSYLSIAFSIGKWRVEGVVDSTAIPVECLRENTRYDVSDRYPIYRCSSYHEIGTLADLSVAGASFVTPNPVETGTVLSCKVRLPEEIFQTCYLYFDAECMWCRESENAGSYQSGYRLRDLSEHDRIIIVHLITHYLDEKESKQRVSVVNRPDSTSARPPEIETV